MINLYILNENRTEEVYGVRTYIKELTAILKNSDINVCVVNLTSGMSQIKTEEINGVKHWVLPAPMPEIWKPDIQNHWELYHRNVVYILQLHIKDKNNLIFHLNNIESEKLAEELKKAFDCRIVSVIHHFIWCYRLFGNATRFRRIIASKDTAQEDDRKTEIEKLYRENKIFYEMMDHIICLSENAQNIVQSDYQIAPFKTTVIYNGLSDCSLITNKKVLLQQYRLSGAPIILFVGRLHYIKGLDYALQAFRIILKTQQPCHFIIAGSGSFDSYMKECEDIWANVTWTGLISKEKLYDLYSIADIGVIPSFHEQCSYVAIEMMMHGLPVIGSTTTGLKEIIIDGETGMHIPVIEHPDSVEIDTGLFAEKILYLLQHPEERFRMGENARKRYEKVYSKEIFRKNMLDFYTSLFKPTDKD